MDNLAALAPREWWDRLEQSLSSADWQPHAECAARAPLAVIAVRFYSGAACWLLAAELQALTGLPHSAERNPWGRALHVFVVDGEDVIDAFGRTPLEGVRTIEDAGGRVDVGIELEAMLATLDERVFTQDAGRVVRSMLDSPRYRACAGAAAREVAASTGVPVR